LSAPPSEVELKCLLDPRDLARARRHPVFREGSAPSRRRLRSLYFDTQDLGLARAGLGLRVRRVGRAWVQTLKSERSAQGGLVDRLELECSVRGPRPEPARLPAPGAELVDAALGARELAAVFETRMRRTSQRLRRGEAALRLELDIGEIRAGAASEPICELEIEVLEGPRWRAWDLALELAGRLRLRPGLASKAQRGVALLTGERPGPRKARRPPLEAGIPLGDALGRIAAAGLEQILVNEIPAFEGGDPEGVHQLRVGVRRLRSVLALFRAVARQPELAALGRELRWLARSLGPARDLDVLLLGLLGPLCRLHAEEPSLKRLREEAALAREEEQGRVRETLRSARYGRCVLAVGRFVERAGWRGSPGAAAFSQPAAGPAATVLEARHGRVHRLGRSALEGSAAERHRLRIRLKKLRYAAEFFASLFPGRRSQRYLRRLTDLQDVLGRLNDLAAADRLLEALRPRLEPGSSPCALALVASFREQEEERGLRRLAREWKGFEAARPFWRDDG
jgi:inorganic triphosphatase YgiF